jgi:endoglucanase
MLHAHIRTTGVAIVAAASLALSMSAAPAVAVASAPASGRNLAANTRFFVPTPDKGSITQIASLIKSKSYNDAYLIGQEVTTPQAVWFTSGTPAQVKMAVQKTVLEAAFQRAVPIIVLYDIPGRDCAQYSAGGALNAADYAAWIDGFATGLGKTKAVIILEPDGLGLLPSGCGLDPSVYPFTDAARYAELNGAVTRLEMNPNASVFLDATHTAWLNVGDASSRLVTAGVQNAQGFFLNVSNFQYSANLGFYGNWISDCIAYATQVAVGAFGSCPNQYWNGGPLPSKAAQLFGEWNGTAMSNYGVWSNDSTTLALNPSAVTQRYINMLGSVVPTTKFVIDSSRNGVGPWAPPSPYSTGQAQDWCNPPDRGLGIKPTANTGDPLLAAYLWVKTPGQSDGQCTRWAPSGGIDPVRGYADPAAGAWMPQLALELAHNAVPALKQLP